MSAPVPAAAAAATVATTSPAEPGRHRLAGRLWSIVRSQPLVLGAAVYIVALVFVAIFAQQVAPYDPNHQDLAHLLEAPTAEHLLGTDDVGRDIVSQVVYGARVALRASLQSVLLALLIGVPIGLLVGYAGGWLDSVVMRLTDAMQSLPGLIVAFSIIAALGRGLTQAMIAVSLLFALNLIRITRAAVMVERERLYVDAARVLGLPQAAILFRQILPNVAAPIIVQATIFLGSAQLIEATLSFLGLGLDRTQPSWGGMLNSASSYQSLQPLMGVAPGMLLTLSILSFNILGDALRDALGTAGGAHKPVARPRTVPAAKPAAKTATVASEQERVPVVPDDAVLRVQNLAVKVRQQDGREMHILQEVSFVLKPGKTLGLVGESGSGKTMTGLALMGLTPVNGWISDGSVRLAGRELVGLSEAELRSVRGKDIAMIFQDPLTALSPVHSIGRQMTAPMRKHLGFTQSQALRCAAELLALVGIVDPEERLGDYPHQFSGGMAQRVMIAMALSCEPKVLVADEPTTALDVTVQNQVLDLLAELRERIGLSIVLSTHDLGVVADICDEALVMYAGEIVESGPVERLFAQPRHPYTSALLKAMPRNQARTGRLPTIPGQVPPPWEWTERCRFMPRCAFAQPRCGQVPVALENRVRCIRADELTLEGNAK